MKKKTLKKIITGVILGIALVLSGESNATPNDLKRAGLSMAPVQLYLFSSLTCPHCKVFHENVLPQIKQQFVDTGQALLIYVDMPYDAKAMTGTVMARCIEPDLYESFMNVLYQNQSVWAYSNRPRALLEGYARVLGADMDSLIACMGNEDVRVHITEQRNNLSRLYNVTGMPTLVIAKRGRSEKISGTDTKVILEKIQNVTEGKVFIEEIQSVTEEK